MSLQSKLLLAFFGLSVIPLAAVTLFSYMTSEAALRRAAAQQADRLAGDLGDRMRWIESDLERRMGQVWPSQGDRQGAGRPTPTSPDENVAGLVAGALGNVAPMVDALEFVPTPVPAPRPPAPEVPPGVPARKAGSVPVAPPPAPAQVGERAQAAAPPSNAASHPTGPRARMVVEMSQVAAEALKGAADATPSSSDISAWTKMLQEEISRAVAQVPGSAPGEPQSAESAPASAPDGTTRHHSDRTRHTRATSTWSGNALHTEFERDGHPIGRINARVNSDRLLRTVLTVAQPEQREIPFAIDAEGRLHSPRASDRAALESLPIRARLAGNTVSVQAVRDWIVATRKDPSGTTIGIARPLSDDLRTLRRTAALNFGVGFALIALVFAGSLPLASGMTRNLRGLMDVVRRLSAGDLEARVAVKSRDEFGRLGAAFNQMASNLAAHERLVVEQERIRRELEVCRRIQTEMLPRHPLRLDRTEVMGLSIPAREVGGDFFNYFVLPRGEVAVLVGDVSGKGVGAALLMAHVQATLHARLPIENDLARLATALDQELAEGTPPEVYLTLFLGVVDPARRVLRYVNAGHNTQYLLRVGAGIEPLASCGRPLGLLPNGGYAEQSVSLADGDTLFLYTDGMVEVENETGDMFGADRLEAVLRQDAGEDVGALLARVDGVVRAFRGNAEPLDDATIMAMRIGWA